MSLSCFGTSVLLLRLLYVLVLVLGYVLWLVKICSFVLWTPWMVMSRTLSIETPAKCWCLECPISVQVLFGRVIGNFLFHVT